MYIKLIGSLSNSPSNLPKCQTGSPRMWFCCIHQEAYAKKKDNVRGASMDIRLKNCLLEASMILARIGYHCNCREFGPCQPLKHIRSFSSYSQRPATRCLLSLYSLELVQLLCSTMQPCLMQASRTLGFSHKPPDAPLGYFFLSKKYTVTFVSGDRHWSSPTAYTPLNPHMVS